MINRLLYLCGDEVSAGGVRLGFTAFGFTSVSTARLAS